MSEIVIEARSVLTIVPGRGIAGVDICSIDGWSTGRRNRTQADAERFVAFDNRVVCHRDHDVLLFPGGADEGQGAGQQAGDVTGFGVARADRVIDREATFDGIISRPP